MHRKPRTAPGFAPGLTPLTGKYVRPDDLWVCDNKFVPGLTVAVDHDISGAEWTCTPAHTVISQGKLIYYAAKFLRVVG